MRKTILTLITTAIGAGLLTAPLAAQVQIEKRRPAPASGWISIDNSFGSVVVKAWENPEVLVRGELAPGAEGLDLDGDEEGVDVDVEVPDAWFYASDDDSEYRSHLTVFAPSGNHVWVESLNASIEIEGFRGEVEVESVNGSVTINGSPTAVEVEGMTGSIEINATGAPMSIESISGDVVIRGAAREVEVETVNGGVTVAGADLESVQIETTSGNVELRGGICPAGDEDGDVEITTFSGTVDLVLEPSVRARFELSTFSGEIHNEIGPRSLTTERFRPYKKLRFSTGLDDCEVMVKTHDADISLQVEGS